MSISVFGQFADNDDSFLYRNLGVQINNNNDMASFLNINNLKMQHSISMSMGGSSLGNESFVSYHNKFYFPLSEKINISGDVILRQQAFSSNPLMQSIGNQNNGIYFDTKLQYKISENSIISIGMSNIPRYNYYNPLYYYGANSIWQNEER